jgi:hypothetical protein
MMDVEPFRKGIFDLRVASRDARLVASPFLIFHRTLFP